CHCASKLPCSGDGCSNCVCSPGFSGQYCNKKCPAGSFGIHCTQLCRCNDPDLCNPETGECQGSCMKGWYHHQCSRFQCHGLAAGFYPDVTSCSRFYWCQKGSHYGLLITCPKNLHWIPETGNCTEPKRVNCTIEKTYTNGSVRANTFHSYLNQLRQSYNSSICKQKITFNTELIVSPSCASTLRNITLYDYTARLHYAVQNFAWRSHDTSYESIYDFVKTAGLALYRHDPNHCHIYHECVYISVRNQPAKADFSHTTLNYCDGLTIFNRQWSTCVNATHVSYGYGSTMDDHDKQFRCNKQVTSAAFYNLERNDLYIRENDYSRNIN
ncbi:unnamed protein product, partial [Didymodactylos carnosus]